MTPHRIARYGLLGVGVIPLLLLLAPVVSFAAISVDMSTYSPPATPLYSGFNGSNGGVLYYNMGATPICPNGATAPSAGSNNSLSTWCSANSGTFNGNTTGNYELLFLQYANCTGSYTTCVAANSAGAPGNEADFVIATPAASSSDATSSPDEVIATTLSLFTEWVVFTGSIILTIWTYKLLA